MRRGLSVWADVRHVRVDVR